MKKILAIDDDPSILEMLAYILEDNNYEVRTSEHGKIEGLIAEYKPDIILLDVLLSGEDGRDIAKRLKSNDATRAIPLIMVSAHPTAREGARLAGADAFVEKPFDIDKLLTVIKKHLS